MVIARFHPIEGGAEVQCKRLSQSLIDRNCDVFVLTQKMRRLRSYEQIGRIPVYRIGWGIDGGIGSLIFCIHGFFWLLKNRHRFDTLHVHLASSPALLSTFLGKLIKKQVIIKIGGSRRTGDVALSSSTWFGRCKLRFLRANVDLFLCPSDEIRQELLKWGFDKTRIRVIPNGIDTKSFLPANESEKLRLRRELSLPEDARIALFAGRFEQGKGIEVLLSAWERMDVSRNWTLVLMGDGKLKDALRKRAAQLPSVLFLGWRPDVIPVYRASDVFVQPSFGEGMSNALLEALSCGLGCIATAIGGTVEIVSSGENGVLVPSGDAAVLAEELSSLLSDPASAARLGLSARRTIEEHFSMDRVADSYINSVYTAVNQVSLGI